MDGNRRSCCRVEGEEDRLRATGQTASAGLRDLYLRLHGLTQGSDGGAPVSRKPVLRFEKQRLPWMQNWRPSSIVERAFDLLYVGQADHSAPGGHRARLP